MDYYLNNDFRLVLNGDIEEGWKSSYSDIIEAYGDTAYHLERQFAQRGKDYYLRTYGNHDIDWANPAMVDAYLKPVIGQPVAVHSGVLLGDQMFITHGHQGDLGSDRNIWLSRRVVRHLWGPLQNMFLFKINRAAENSLIRRNRDKFLQQWGKANRLMVIAGHTHRPMLHPFPALKNLVQFSSGNGHNTVPDLNTLFFPEDGVDPTMYYINDGCCVHSDGITGIEIDRGVIRLVKWATTTSIAGRNGSGMCGISQIVRSIFRSTDLETLLAAL
ncbi:MAG: hypothetical protein JW966_07580 [Anaerolineae bacterium]|nr:hypothetical protein [Anaerolineae bacterium]